MNTEKDYPVKIPKWVYDRITELTDCVVGDTQWAVTRRQTLRRFLAHIWLEADDDGWTINTVRDIRSCYASLLGQCEISYQGECFMSTLTDFLPTLPDIEFRAGKASKDPDKRKASVWRFNPQQPVSDLGKLNLVDLETGESVSFRDLIKGNWKAPRHAMDVEKRQTDVKRREKAFLAKVTRGRMSIQFVKELRSREPDTYYRAGIRSLNHLYNGRIEGQYVTYDHYYRLTFGGRYYDQAFQNLPNELKAKFRSGLLNYDIEACNLACLNHLFRGYKIDYCVDASIYAEMMEHTGLTRKQCKAMVHTTTYRIGRVTIGINDGLGAKVYEWCGNSRKKALKLLRWWNQYVSPLRCALETLLERVHEAHRKSCSSPRNYHRYANEVGLILDLNSEEYQREKTHHQQYARNKALLAFMICGVEQAYIREVVSLNPGRVCMLDHDGVVATGVLVLPDWRGFTMKVKD
ncbi:hypothetical protein DNU50_03730 [Salmonella enterica subsp. enterica serovar Warnow]|uniref:Uncharacterized protein n=1 Tax=Salmonella enterica TaxID=28901 RepID=A0A5U4SEJ2_SALER|nr:hypothetical protein [Salmonella enterica subsp. enterica serovar Aba]EAB5770314.1 hypothetical protein [Salmonella enterica subsp. enterica serovar Warnow]EAP9251426.1 hypothetical protein [Salmonella enterica]EBX7380519.1 hypothetical protein [Salmonella enterica subsp. enterica serovar Takoradi]EDS6600588.1 hypothetical protein [Salmonella enterica subsp. enterica]